MLWKVALAIGAGMAVAMAIFASAFNNDNFYMTHSHLRDTPGFTGLNRGPTLEHLHPHTGKPFL